MILGGNFFLLSVVLVIECKLCEISIFFKLVCLSVVFIVWLFIGWLGLIWLGKINFWLLLRGFIIFRIVRVLLDSGIVWFWFIFIWVVGIFYLLVLKLILFYWVLVVLVGWVMVRSCYMNRYFVDMLIFVVRMVCISCGSWFGWMFGMFFFCGFLKVFLIFILGIVLIRFVFCV